MELQALGPALQGCTVKGFSRLGGEFLNRPYSSARVMPGDPYTPSPKHETKLTHKTWSRGLTCRLGDQVLSYLQGSVLGSLYQAIEAFPRAATSKHNA